MFYECASNFEAGAAQSHLPTADEVMRRHPNPCGYATGMEDCAILTGVMLAAIADKYSVHPEDALKPFAQKAFAGLEKCVMPDGFVARGICVEDGVSFYISSSVDQYTHCIHGLWKYFKSSLSDAAQKARAAECVRRIADRIERNATSENDFDSLRSDGSRDPLGISRFSFDAPHAAARRAMVYSAAFDMTADEKYARLLEPILARSVEESEKIKLGPHTPIYSLLQMQISLEVLRSAENSRFAARIDALMKKVAELADSQAEKILNRFLNADIEMPYGDWRNPPVVEIRNGYAIPKLGESRRIWRILRETGEIPLVAAAARGFEMPEASARLFKISVEKINYDRCSSAAGLFDFAAYWKARAQDTLPKSLQ